MVDPSDELVDLGAELALRERVVWVALDRREYTIDGSRYPPATVRAVVMAGPEHFDRRHHTTLDATGSSWFGSPRASRGAGSRPRSD